MHYAETLREWRRRFNRNIDVVKSQVRASWEPSKRSSAVLTRVCRWQGFDDVFIRCWNYYLCYCEAAFETKVSVAWLHVSF